MIHAHISMKMLPKDSDPASRSTTGRGTRQFLAGISLGMTLTRLQSLCAHRRRYRSKKRNARNMFPRLGWKTAAAVSSTSASSAAKRGGDIRRESICQKRAAPTRDKNEGRQAMRVRARVLTKMKTLACISFASDSEAFALETVLIKIKFLAFLRAATSMRVRARVLT